MTDEPFDLCLSVNGPNADVLLPLCLTTLFQHTNMEKMVLHLVNNGCSKPVAKHMRKVAAEKGGCFYHLPSLPISFVGPDNVPDDHFATDTAKTCQWMVEHCGSSDVVFLSHFDVIFKGDIFAHYRNIIDARVGQIGEHSSGLVGYRRSALSQTSVGFGHMSHFKVVEDATGAWKIRPLVNHHGGRDIGTLHAFDVAELLELELVAKGWNVFQVPQHESDPVMEHIRSGSGYMDASINSLVRDNALRILHALNIKPIT